ncbi:MAG: glycosyltransferase family 39 protein [Anaerolineae bacterium]|nr:glycosyltransferase family 39 protein [Anaerolineae bacterium]
MDQAKSPLSLERRPALQRLFFFLIVLTALYLLIQSIDPITALVDTAVKAVPFPYSLDYGEGPLLDQAVRLSQWEGIYPDEVQSPPYTITNYPPLYPLVLTPFVWFFGPHLWYARLISIISTMAVACFLFLILYKLTTSWLAAGIAALTFLVMPAISTWSVLARVDSFALALSFAGLYLLVRNPQNRANRIGAACLITAAIYTRQSYGLAAPVAAFLFLLKDKPRKNAFEFAGWVALIGLSAFMTLNVISNGGFFFHVFTANMNPFRWETVIHYMTEAQTHYLLFFILGVLYLLGGIWKPIRQDAWWLTGPYFLLGTLTALTIGKDGSNVNYLYEMYAGIALLTGALLGLTRENQHYRWVQFGLLALLFFPITGAIQLNLEEYADRHHNRMAEATDLALLQNWIAQTDGAILADEHMSMVVTAGKPLRFQPFEYKMLENAGLWDQSDFLTSIREKQFSLVLLYDPPWWDSRSSRWSPEQLAAIEENYGISERVADTLVYQPLP